MAWKPTSRDGGPPIATDASRWTDAPGLPAEVAPFSSGPAPLSETERARAVRAGRRLQSELRRALATLPATARGTSGLSRYLDLNRATSHRVVTAAGPKVSDVDVLLNAPGVQGLRQFARAAEKRGADADVIAAVDAAVTEFEALLDDLGGSQSALARRLGSDPASGDGSAGAGGRDPCVVRRERLVAATADFLGRAMDARVELVALAPDPVDPARLQRAWQRGIIGYQARADSLPLACVTGAALSAEGFATLGPGPDSGPHAAPIDLIERLSSSPAPVITARGDQKQRALVIEPADARGKTDIVLGNRVLEAAPNPAFAPPTEPDATEEAGTGGRDDFVLIVREATRALLFDVYLHRSLARGCIPSVEHVLWSPTGPSAELLDRWWDRFGAPPLLKVLGPGTRHAASAVYPRQPEFTSCFFERTGWNPADFVGYRCEVEFPAPGTCYIMVFDYARAQSE